MILSENSQQRPNQAIKKCQKEWECLDDQSFLIFQLESNQYENSNVQIISLCHLKINQIPAFFVTQIPSTQRRSFSNLKILNLYSNKITSIQNLQFVNLQNLEKLFLFNNLISSLKTFRKCHFNMLAQEKYPERRRSIIEQISLSHNLIIQFQFLRHFDCQSLTKLRMHNNPLKFQEDEQQKYSIIYDNINHLNAFRNLFATNLNNLAQIGLDNLFKHQMIKKRFPTSRI